MLLFCVSRYLLSCSVGAPDIPLIRIYLYSYLCLVLLSVLNFSSMRAGTISVMFFTASPDLRTVYGT